MIHITILGTGTSQGVPVIACNCAVCQSTDSRDKRLRTSVLVQSKNTTIVIDVGPDFRAQMLRAKAQNLDAVLLTHEHTDHVAGLDDLRPLMFKNRVPMPLYGEANVLEAVKRRFDYAFIPNPYPGSPSFALREIVPGPLKIQELEFIALRAIHGTLPILGFKIKNFAYLTDVNGLPEETMTQLNNLDILVLDALHITPHHSHFNLAEALEMAAKIGAKKTYFTHMSHHIGLHNEVENQLPKNVFLAYDGLNFAL